MPVFYFKNNVGGKSKLFTNLNHQKYFITKHVEMNDFARHLQGLSRRLYDEIFAHRKEPVFSLVLAYS